MRPSSRSSDDADVIRARLRALLDERRRPGGWLPDDELHDALDRDPDSDLARDQSAPLGAAAWSTGPRPGPLPSGAGGAGAGLPLGLGRHRLPGAAVRLDPGRRGVWSLWTAGVVAALLVVAWTWWHRPQVRPVPASGISAASASAGLDGPASAGPARRTAAPTLATAAPLVVSVVGRVHRPGLVTLEPGARVADALAAAGGLLPGADAASVNLAALVTDGQQIAVGVPGATADQGGQATASGAAGGGAPVNLNSATAADLDGLPGIGPVLAQRIVDYRKQQGPFTAVDQLDDVPGIGPALFAQLRKRVTV